MKKQPLLCLKIIRFLKSLKGSIKSASHDRQSVVYCALVYYALESIVGRFVCAARRLGRKNERFLFCLLK